MKESWQVDKSYDEERSEKLAKDLSIPLSIAKLLDAKNLQTNEEVLDFLQPLMTNLHSPFLMKDMNKAVLRIKKALQNNELICILGDFDVDGTCGIAVLFKGLKRLGANLNYFVPHRVIDGYGFSINNNGFSLLHPRLRAQQVI